LERLSRLEDRGNFVELPHDRATCLRFFNLVLVLVFIRNNGPLLWKDAFELPSRFDVRLVKAREHVSAAVNLKLGVEILELIHLVRERMEAFAVVPVLVVDLHRHNIVACIEVLWCQEDHVLGQHLLGVAIFVLDQLVVDGESCD